MGGCLSFVNPRYCLNCKQSTTFLCCRAPPPGWVDEYCAATKGKLDLFAVHQYSGVECKVQDRQAGGWSFMDLQHTLKFGDFVAKWVKVRDANMSADTGIFVEETASTVVGGRCQCTAVHLPVHVLSRTLVALCCHLDRRHSAGFPPSTADAHSMLMAASLPRLCQRKRPLHRRVLLATSDGRLR